MKSIISSFKSQAEERSGMLLFTPTIAIVVITKLEQAGIPVLGLDAFKVFEEKVQPSQEQSVDLSRQTGTTWEQAKKFLAEKTDSGLFFEITADD